MLRPPVLVLDSPLAVTLVAFTAAALLMPAVIALAQRFGFVAHPKEDRWHSRPTALMGGIGVYLAVSLSWLLAPAPGFEILTVWLAGTLMFITGLVDDVRDISPATKLVAQIAAASLLFYGGLRLDLGGPMWLGYAVTLLWVVGVTNAVNLLDNMDGLAAGITAIAAGVLGAVVALRGDLGSAALAWGLSAGAVGFLLYNFNPARVFMGDSGSLFLGISIAALSLAVPLHGTPSEVVLVFLVPAAVMAVPIFDTTLVTAKRILSGRPVSQGGRDHSSHRLVWLGLSERRAVLTLYAVSALFGGLALGFEFLDAFLFLPLLALCVIALAIFGIFLGELKVYEPEVERRAEVRLRGQGSEDGVLLRAVMRNKQQVLAVVADLVLIVSSLVIAYYLRYDLRLGPSQQRALALAQPVMVVAKLLVFFGAGMYRRLWRYTGTREVLAVVQSSTLASLVGVALLGFGFGFSQLSRSVFVIDWIVATVALVVARGALRGLRGYFNGHRTSGRRVLLYGAGEAGYLAAREIAYNREHGLVAVGFIDDDPAKHRLNLNGIPIVAAGEDIAALCRRHRAAEVIVTTGALDSERVQELRRQCASAGVTLRRLNLGFADVGESLPVAPLRASARADEPDVLVQGEEPPRFRRGPRLHAG
jgi:UDP-GlcNAc:undecaprenyl-phosphate GlcNAc-1-phosphate transferase